MIVFPLFLKSGYLGKLMIASFKAWGELGLIYKNFR